MTGTLAPPRPPSGGLLLFVDFDGTFYHRAEPRGVRRDRLKQIEPLATVVVVTSRTVPEVRRMVTPLGFRGDVIAENGAVADWHGPHAAAQLIGPVAGNGNRSVGEDAWDALAAAGLGRGCLTWSDFRSGSLRRRASVRIPAAKARSLQDPRTRAVFARAGLNVALGGHWVTIWRGPDKGEAASRYRDRWMEVHGRRPATIAIGNAENDEPMLRVATHRWALADEGSDFARRVHEIGGAVFSGRPTEAWETILDRLRRLKED